ncbi:hypothetical protein CHN50_10275 [Priestia aryabhattai]|uniref:YesK family protein n=1 Tax=Priestia TaxID=2800373 RepID=UPI000BA133BB|nr:YesK family protein [Priestia flexa]MBY6023581.1 hypothetical protein [Nitratireductor sp. DP7N14-4]MDT2048329.1 YesK family protein [Priestia flexa]OZT12804.1 hypothetical protein CHN50_10275 [Priestia aryabhattai]USY55592.1 hypothetical protein NIZ91_02590 [Bacillus sp. 1780r2a1]
MLNSYTFIIMTTLVILIFSYLIGRKKESLRYVIPLAVAVLSLAGFIISLLVGGWEGLGYGALSIMVFIAAVLSLLIMTIAQVMKRRK